MNARSLLSATLIFLTMAHPLWGWSERGHHLITVMAFRLMNDLDRQTTLEIIQHHPRMAKDFEPPKDLQGPEALKEWLVGRCSAWPNIARTAKDELSRPTWHFQLGSSMVLGNVGSLHVHPTPDSNLPDGATMETQELYLEQAIGLCRQTLSNSKSRPSDRALAWSWLSHLIADAHQPCHVGSLYAESIFPEGDRGANSIPTKQKRNMHTFWDGLLGEEFDRKDVDEKISSIQRDSAIIAKGEQGVSTEESLQPATWLRESRALALTHLYTPEIVLPLTEGVVGGKNALRPIDLSETYQANAESASRTQAVLAAYRIHRILEECYKASR